MQLYIKKKKPKQMKIYMEHVVLMEDQEMHT